MAPSQVSATLDCKKIRADGYTFDLSKLDGPHSVVTSKYNYAADTHINTTYTVDICKPLKKSGKKAPKEECPNGTRGECELVSVATATETDENPKSE